MSLTRSFKSLKTSKENIMNILMKQTSMALGIAVTMAALLAGSAHAGNIIIYPGPSPEQPTDSSITLNFISATAQSVDLSFTIDGYGTLDGQNFYEDDFSLSLNGPPIFVGTFNLGGGSNTTQAVIYSNPYGGAYTNP